MRDAPVDRVTPRVLVLAAAGLVLATAVAWTASTAHDPLPRRPQPVRTTRLDAVPETVGPRRPRRPKTQRARPHAVPDAVRWRRSRSLGLPYGGRLVRGVKLPAEGRHFFSWDPVRQRSPNRSWRRFGSDRLLRTLIAVLDRYANAHPEAPRVGIGDLSRRRGGAFGPRYGWPGHASHQNGLDVDVYYPRRDRRELPVKTPVQIDLQLAQHLVNQFVRAGAKFVFVGPNTHLHGPANVVQVLPRYHDNHMHVRLPADNALGGNRAR